MKIVLCKGQFLGPISGVDETIVAYATELKHAGHDPSVLTLYSHPSDRQYEEPLATLGIKVIHITDHPAHYLLAAARNAVRTLTRVAQPTRRRLQKDAEKITRRIANLYHDSCQKQFAQSGADVVHVFTPDAATPILISAARSAAIPVLYQEMGTPSYSSDHRPYYHRLIKALPLCSEVAALSPGLAGLLRERYRPPAPVSVLPIMIEDLRNGHGTAPRSNRIVFGFAARFDETKCPLTLVRAFARLRSQFPECNAYLKMAGDGPLASDLQRHINTLGIADRCLLPGIYFTREQKAAFFSGVDVLVQPSLAEGTPNSIVEAMSFGMPVIASAVGGIPEVVSTETGILVPPQDETALAQAMRTLAENEELRAKMGRAARARYEMLFRPDKVMPIMLDLYDRLAGNKNGNVESPTTKVSPSGALQLHPWTQIEYAQ